MSSLDDYYRTLGREVAMLQGRAAIQKCNCMVRYNDGCQLPAIHWKGEFFDPAGRPIVKPTSYEKMRWYDIAAVMKECGEVFIGHIFPVYTVGEPDGDTDTKQS